MLTPMTSTRRRLESLVMEVQAAFLADPTLSLTLAGARQRFGVEAVTCGAVLRALVAAGVLTKRDGHYRRNFPDTSVRSAA